MYNYYRDQLKKLNKKSCLYCLVLSDFEGNKTFTLALEKQSIKEVRKFLDRVEKKLNKKAG